MKRVILIILTTLLIFNTSFQEEKVYAGEVIGGQGGIIAQGIMELLMLFGIGYDFSFKTPAMEECEYLENKLMTRMELTETERLLLENSQLGYVTWYYDNVYDEVHYSDGSVYKPTRINGKDYFVNPYYQEALSAVGQWQAIMSASDAITSMGITSAYQMTQAMKQNITETQVLTSNALKACMNLTASSVAMAKKQFITSTSATVTVNGQTFSEPNYRYFYVVDLLYRPTKYIDYTLNTINAAGTYLIFTNQVPYIYTSYGDDMLVNGEGQNAKTYKVYGNQSQIQNSFTMVNDTWKTVIRDSNCDIKKATTLVYHGTSTYNPDAANTYKVGAFSSVIDNTLTIPATGVIGLTDEEKKAAVGLELPDVAYPTTDIAVPAQPADTAKEFEWSLWGWLESIWDAIIGIPAALWGFIQGILDLIYNAIIQVVDAVKAVATTIVNIFVIDWAVVEQACLDLSVTWENKFGAVISIANQFTDLTASNMTEKPPVITLPAPDILKPYLKSDTITVVDLNDFADSFSIARGIISAILWVTFGYFIINNFVPKFNIN